MARKKAARATASSRRAITHQAHRAETRLRTAANRAGAIESQLSLNDLLGKLQTLLRAGNFDAAKKELDEAGSRPIATVNTLPVDDEGRMRAAAIIGEILFVYGDDASAQRLLKRYATRSKAWLASSLTAREKLQLAEYHYTLSNVSEAERVASQILDEILRGAPIDFRSASWCLYYLARFSSRQNKYKEANERCIKSLELLHRAGATIGADALNWQTGRLLRVRGNALWWRAYIDEATAVLYLAASLLKQSVGSRIHLGDVLHALGRLLRSQGPRRQPEAFEALEDARLQYDGHDLKLARACTDLARTIQNMAFNEEDAEKRKDLFAESEKALTEAVTLSEKHKTRGKLPVVWSRQKIDALVWKSWFHQQAPPPFEDPAAALKAATEAFSLATSAKDTPEAIEAALALGYCRMQNDEFSSARKLLTDAWESADKLGIPKLAVHARLCLAELSCLDDQDTKAARSHLDEAQRRIKQAQSNATSLSSFLSEKAARVEAKIEALVNQQGDFFLRRDDLLTGPAATQYTLLDKVALKAQMWAVRVTRAAKGGNQHQAGIALGVSDHVMREVQRRYAKMNALPPAGTKKES